jgi:hypothetical protein
VGPVTVPNREQRRRMAQHARRAHREVMGTEPELVSCIPPGVVDGHAEAVTKVEASGCFYCDADMVIGESPDGGMVVHVDHDSWCPRLAAIRERN